MLHEAPPSPPYFSLIVPVHNVRAYLRDCLDSLLAQSYGDFEVVAVDDASPDGSGAVLDEYAARDSRVRVVHLEHNVGLGLARNAGLEHARGRYLLFVDSDDVMTPGALGAIHKRILGTDEPDVVIFDYARVYWWGAGHRNVMASTIEQAAYDSTFTIDKHPELLRLLMVAWNKACRRDFVLEHGFRFYPGFYEDLPWTYPVLLSARSIAVLDQVCIHYRQRRHGNILRSRSSRHLDVFDQYRSIFEYIDAHPELNGWRDFLFGRMLTHFMTIWRADNRLLKSERREFFDRMVATSEALRPAGYQVAKGAAGAKIQVLQTGNYAAFRLAHSTGAVVRKAKKARVERRKSARTRFAAAKKSLMLKYYWTNLRLPLDPGLAVYAAQWANAYTGNPRAIYEHARETVPGVRGVWVVKKSRTRVLPQGVPYVIQGSLPYYRVMARAKFLFNDVNFPDDIVKRRGSIHVQTKHGTPLKKMGLELQEYPLGAAGMSFRNLLRRSDRWDYVISSNRHSSEVWERSFPCDYLTLESGYPRNDRLVRATSEDTRAARRKLGLADSATVVLYAPTFRDWSRAKFTPPLNLAKFAESLGDDFVLLVRTHYLTSGDEALQELTASGVIRNVSEYSDVEELMIASDVLLTDYSSIQFDYANLNRPIVLYANDWETYKRTRGVTFDVVSFPPGCVEFNLAGLVDAFTSGRYADGESRRLLSAFRERFCQFDDGHAAERVVRQIFLGEHLPAVTSLHSTGVQQTEMLPGDASPTRADILRLDPSTT